MKTSDTLVRTSIVTVFLLGGLFGCASESTRTQSSAQSSTDRTPVTIMSAETTPADAPAEASMDQATVAESRAEAGTQKAVELKTSHPRQYTVKKGDTLWDISSLFLTDPWYWPEIWHKNQQVKNPHLIYPGDVLTLIYVKGQPRITMQKQLTTNTVATAQIPMGKNKISPRIRRSGLDASIATIPGDAIRQFTTRPRVVTKEELEKAPYIVASDDNHLIMGESNRIYVRGELDKERVRFTVFRPGKKLIDPESGETLGYEAIYSGEAHITEYGDPATGILTSTNREVLIGDRLLPLDKSKVNNLYFPRVPDRKVHGTIISLYDALFGIAKFQIAVINRGARDGLEVGHLLETRTAGLVVTDKHPNRRSNEVKLPETRTGLMMVFRTFDHVSYGLILESQRVIRNHDRVVSPL